MKHAVHLGLAVMLAGLVTLIAPDAHAAATFFTEAKPIFSSMSDFTTSVAMAAAGVSFGRKDATGGGGGNDGDDLGALSVKLKEITDTVKNFGEDITKKMVSGQKLSDEIKEKADKALTAQGELMARIDEVEQKLSRRGGKEEAEHKSLGKMVIENEDVKSYMDRKPRGGVKIDAKAITSAANSGEALVDPDRQTQIITQPDRRMTVRDLLTPGTTGSNAIEYVRETGFTNAAAPTAENTAKPESNITFELVTTGVKTIAHWIPASKQILDDAPMLMSYVDGRLRYGLAFEEELQLLKGDGTGQNLNGIITQATAYVAPFVVAAETEMDKIRLAMLQAVLAEYPTTGTVLNPTDWARVELTKDSEGRYIIGDPKTSTTPTLWGRPVVQTQAIDVDKFLTGAFQLGAQVFDREQATVEISTEHADNFTKNMVTVRGEERLALAVYRPEAFIYGDLGNVA